MFEVLKTHLLVDKMISFAFETQTIRSGVSTKRFKVISSICSPFQVHSLRSSFINVNLPNKMSIQENHLIIRKRSIETL